MNRLIFIACVFFFVIYGEGCSRAQQDRTEDPPLWLAVQAHDYSLAKKLLNNGADPNAHLLTHCTPLFLAMGNDDTMLVLLLLNHKANLYDTSFGVSIGERAARSNSWHSLEILNKYGYPLTMRNEDDESLIRIAVRCSAYQTVSFLLQHGSDSNEADSYGTTLLMDASMKDITGNGDTEMVSLLLRAGADPNKSDSKSFYPIYCAMIRLEGIPRFISKISNQGVQYEDSGNFTTCQNTHRRIVELLLKAGANPNVEDHPGGSPLSEAVKYCDTETLKLLLHYGASPKTLSSRGQYVLQKAKNNACDDVLQLLK